MPRTLSLLFLLTTLALPLATPAQTGMSADLHREVQATNRLLEEGKDREAIGRLETLSRRGNLNNYEKAVLQQMLGFAHVGNNDPAQARTAFESALSFGNLPEQVTNGVTVALAQVCLDLGDLECSRRHIDQVVAATASPDADLLAVAAYIYYELKQYDAAEGHIRKAIAASKEPSENWYQILLAIYREQQAWGKAEQVLRELIARQPDNGNYWQFLSYVLFAQDKMHDALATLMLAWRLGLVKGNDLERIVGFHANLGIPERAARLLEDWVASGEIDATGDRAVMLGRLWLIARERDKATGYLARAAESASDGNIDLLLGKLMYEDESWQQAITHLEQALKKGSLDDGAEAEAQLLLGISAYHADRKAVAKTAFEAAQRTPRYRDHAGYWLNLLQEEG